MKLISLAAFLLLAARPAATAAAPAADTVRLSGQVVDAATGASLPSRLYIEKAGELFLARSADPAGSAVAYKRSSGRSVEIHSTLSAHSFEADLPPGRYTITAERGKEYLPASVEVLLEREPARVTLKLRRWIDMAARGWYSGDTHVHRSLEELPNLLLAEDLNIAFPLLYWVTRAFTPPSRGDKSSSVAEGADQSTITVDPKHLIVPRNTEYEIFTVDGKGHELGAFFAIGHRSVLTAGVPPVRAVGEQVHREGGLIELDKHCWPWSMALVPILGVDLYELSNNHVWRTEFAYKGWGATPAKYMDVETDGRGFTERGWVDYGFKNYYALLNCGFRLRPTAGTASGVHPVPLGFSRVYVRLPESFSAAAWLRELNAGRSFVTTGPMILFEVARPEAGAGRCRVTGTVLSAGPLSRLEVVMNGQVAAAPPIAAAPTADGGRECRFEVDLSIEGTSWIAARVFEDAPAGRFRFAHTAPVFIEVEGKPLLPRREEVDYLRSRVAEQIERSKDVLPPPALDEYREALRAYDEIAKKAR